jgi:hypothetical protein
MTASARSSSLCGSALIGRVSAISGLRGDDWREKHTARWDFARAPLIAGNAFLPLFRPVFVCVIAVGGLGVMAVGAWGLRAFRTINAGPLGAPGSNGGRALAGGPNSSVTFLVRDVTSDVAASHSDARVIELPGAYSTLPT